MSVVVVQVTSENSESERRFEKGISIYALKVKLELITGIPADFQQLDLYDESNLLGTLEGDPDRLLGSFPIENGYRIGVLFMLNVRSKISILIKRLIYTTISRRWRNSN